MPRDSFPPGVAEQLDWYVYRLIDPRNGETFYVGKGKGNRLFEHARGLVADADEEMSDPKLQRIKEIQAAGLDVSHVIHRHGMKTQHLAYEVESALIDAYPGLTNKVRGRGSRDFGSRHVEEIIDEFTAEEFMVKEPLILISIGTMFYQRSVYDAVRCAWKLNKERADGYNLVLAHLRGLVVGAFRPKKWLPATIENFPLLEGHREMPDRLGFVGEQAELEAWDYYVRKRVPAKYRKPGAQNATRYCDPTAALTTSPW